jgi:cysteine desulfurase/selenocysteine lyase
MLCEEKGAVLRVIPMDDRGVLDVDAYADLLGPKTKLVGLVHASNALGTVNPVAQMAAMARERGVVVLVDGAQAAPHGPVDVDALGCDFYVLSGHKTFGPTGVGALWGRKELLDAMPPYQGGGDMIRTVTFAGSTWAPVPQKFEAGTPHIGGVIGFGAALDWMMAQDWKAIQSHEQDLLEYATERAQGVDGMRLIGTAPDKVAVLSFVLDMAHAHDVGTIIDMEGVAIRTGHHCAQPVMDHFGVPATARASFALYNTRDEVDALFTALERVVEMFG